MVCLTANFLLHDNKVLSYILQVSTLTRKDEQLWPVKYLGTVQVNTGIGQRRRKSNGDGLADDCDKQIPTSKGQTTRVSFNKPTLCKRAEVWQKWNMLVMCSTTNSWQQTTQPHCSSVIWPLLRVFCSNHAVCDKAGMSKQTCVKNNQPMVKHSLIVNDKQHYYKPLNI